MTKDDMNRWVEDHLYELRASCDSPVQAMELAVGLLGIMLGCQSKGAGPREILETFFDAQIYDVFCRAFAEGNKLKDTELVRKMLS